MLSVSAATTTAVASTVSRPRRAVLEHRPRDPAAVDDELPAERLGAELELPLRAALEQVSTPVQ